MEQNPCLKPAVDPSSQQFRHQLNQWFEQHGVLDNLRSHLRSVMITALQQTEFRLKPHQKTTPKVQSANLLVAEYLLKQGCHYTLSILMSELPSLANFSSGAILLRCGPEGGKSREKFRFEEKEVIEILNSLGVSSRDENLRIVCDCYSRTRDEESLLECLLRFVAEPEYLKRYGAGHVASGKLPTHVSDAVKIIGENIHGIPPQISSMMSEGDLKIAVEEEKEKRLRDLIEREKRIQDYLKSHEDNMMARLKSAEKELNARRETIDRELSERQLHLGRIAFQLKDKHREIMELSESFATVKSENVALRSKLDGVQVELNELREELERKSEIIERLEAERMSLKCHVQEYLKWKRREGTDEKALTSNFHDGTRRKSSETMEKQLPKRFEGDSPSSGDSSGEEALLNRVKARVDLLDHENARIGEKYFKYKKKYENPVEYSRAEESYVATVLDAQQEVCPEKLVEPTEREVRPEKEDVAVTCHRDIEEWTSATQIKVTTVEEEKRMPIPTRRQQKNLDFYLRSRSLLEALEKSSGGFFDGEASASDSSRSSRAEPPEKSVIGGNNASARETESGFRELSDLECLTLLKEARTEKAADRDGGG